MGLIIAIALWVISVMARGGLIAGVDQVEEDGETTLGRAWAVGQHRFWTLFGIGVLTVLPIIVIVVAMIVGLVLVAGGGAALTNVRGDQAAGPIVAGVFACLCPSICLLVVATALLSQIRIYAERAAILDNLGWIDAFGRGWRVLRDNLGPTLLLWLVFLVLGSGGRRDRARHRSAYRHPAGGVVRGEHEWGGELGAPGGTLRVRIDRDRHRRHRERGDRHVHLRHLDARVPAHDGAAGAAGPADRAGA